MFINVFSKIASPDAARNLNDSLLVKYLIRLDIDALLEEVR